MAKISEFNTYGATDFVCVAEITVRDRLCPNIAECLLYPFLPIFTVCPFLQPTP
ncbi:hypothetical protein ACN4EK_21920 [Pantanalinema rosaneae CENA516]|uniref:hypothetical protein n=1 Tax=Pantanalinema rosaneae TaxID=1620701 RepID=UPI003D6ED608